MYFPLPPIPDFLPSQKSSSQLFWSRSRYWIPTKLYIHLPPLISHLSFTCSSRYSYLVSTKYPWKNRAWIYKQDLPNEYIVLEYFGYQQLQRARWCWHALSICPKKPTPKKWQTTECTCPTLIPPQIWKGDLCFNFNPALQHHWLDLWSSDPNYNWANISLVMDTSLDIINTHAITTKFVPILVSILCSPVLLHLVHCSKLSPWQKFKLVLGGRRHH